VGFQLEDRDQRLAPVRPAPSPRAPRYTPRRYGSTRHPHRTTPRSWSADGTEPRAWSADGTGPRAMSARSSARSAPSCPARLLARLRAPRRVCRLLDVTVPGPVYAAWLRAQDPEVHRWHQERLSRPVGGIGRAGRSSPEVNCEEAGTGDLAQSASGPPRADLQPGQGGHAQVHPAHPGGAVALGSLAAQENLKVRSSPSTSPRRPSSIARWRRAGRSASSSSRRGNILGLIDSIGQRMQASPNQR
jgi:hypothetical protein